MTTSARPFPFRSPSFPPVHVHSPGLSAPVSRRFLFLPCFARFLSSARFALPDPQLPVLPFSPPSVPLSQWLSQRPHVYFRSRKVFPLRLTSFPVSRFRFRLFSSLFVSFHPSLLRSHSRSTGAHVQSPSFPPVPFRVFSCRLLAFAPLRFRARLLSLPFLPFPSSYIPLTVVPVLPLPFPVSVSGLHLLFPFPVPAYPHFLTPVSMCPSVIRYSASLHIPFNSDRSPHSGYLHLTTFVPSTSRIAPFFGFPFRPFPLACALGSVYSAWYDVP